LSHNIAVTAAGPDLQTRAEALAAELGLATGVEADTRALLSLTETRLEIRPIGADVPGAIAVDFGAGKLRHRRRGGHNEPLGRAVGVGKWPDLAVIDATAGLGRDSFVLADLGCKVTMLERSAVVFALLRDGLSRGLGGDDVWVREVCERLELVHCESREWLGGNAGSADVVYLDPMFPARRKSARVKKEMWLFQQLLESGAGAPGLLEAARNAARKRVVVKRPAKAPPLEDRKPDFELPGKTVRFDVYLP
jgi:16S rRNA (guanine1516-N2)-methyltransferase